MIVRPVPAPPHPAYGRVRDAADIAEQVLPGPVGEFLRRELGAWCDSGWRFDPRGWGEAIADDLLARPFPRRPIP